jgi:hypothetical protein
MASINFTLKDMNSWLVFVLIASYRVAFSQDAASACNPVLQRGNYNTLSTSSSTITYSQFNSVMCQLSSGASESYAQYQSSQLTDSTYYTNVAAAASYLGFGGSASVGTGGSQLSESKFSTPLNLIHHLIVHLKAVLHQVLLILVNISRTLTQWYIMLTNLVMLYIRLVFNSVLRLDMALLVCMLE